jgi:hypothetical protein
MIEVAISVLRDGWASQEHCYVMRVNFSQVQNNYEDYEDLGKLERIIDLDKDDDLGTELYTFIQCTELSQPWTWRIQHKPSDYVFEISTKHPHFVLNVRHPIQSGNWIDSAPDGVMRHFWNELVRQGFSKIP